MVSKDFEVFHPWGRFPIWRAYFSNGLVQPPEESSRIKPTIESINFDQVACSRVGQEPTLRKFAKLKILKTGPKLTSTRTNICWQKDVWRKMLSERWFYRCFFETLSLISIMNIFVCFLRGMLLNLFLFRDSCQLVIVSFIGASALAKHRFKASGKIASGSSRNNG